MTGPRLRAVRAEVVALPTARPFVTALRRTSAADTLRVELLFDDGLTAAGWASPVPQVTGETAKGAQAAARGVVADALTGRALLDRAGSLGALAGCLPGNGAAKAAVDMAWHLAAARHLEVTVGALLGSAADTVFTDQTLPLGETDAAVDAARAAAAAGYRCVKVKVDDRPGTAQTIAAVAHALPPHVQLRVDANQAWSRRTAVEICDQLERRDVRLDYLEQPLPARDLRGAAWLRDRIRYPLLADESVSGAADVLAVAESGAADAVNVKLAKAGGAHAALAAAAVAQAAGLAVVVGCMLEHPLAVAFAGRVAAAVAPTTTHDLDAAGWFSHTAHWYRPPHLQLEAADRAD